MPHGFLSRRRVLEAGAAGLGGLALAATGRGAEPVGDRGGKAGVFELPVGSAPPPVPCDHFPTRVHALVWRNWPLVPYSQLVELLGWSQERLAFTLLEDNFLFHKLGASKPNCQPVRHRPADEAVRHREVAIAAIVRESFPDLGSPPREQLFEFISAISRPLGQPASPRPTAGPLRLVHSPFASFGDQSRP